LDQGLCAFIQRLGYGSFSTPSTVAKAQTRTSGPVSRVAGSKSESVTGLTPELWPESFWNCNRDHSGITRGLPRNAHCHFDFFFLSAHHFFFASEICFRASALILGRPRFLRFAVGLAELTPSRATIALLRRSRSALSSVRMASRVKCGSFGRGCDRLPTIHLERRTDDRVYHSSPGDDSPRLGGNLPTYRRGDAHGSSSLERQEN